MNRAAVELVAAMTCAFGQPVKTPAWICGADGRIERSRYRVFKWRCPVCGGGFDDPDRIHRPLTVDSDGEVWCSANRCTPEQIGEAVRRELDLCALLDTLEGPA
jgi:hypothetical protein